MSTATENYIGYEALISYIIESKNWSYYGFLSHNRDTIIASLAQLTSSTFTSARHSFDVAWSNRFLDEAEELLDSNTFAELKKKFIAERSRYAKKMQIFWQGVVKEYDKENAKECDKENTKECDKENDIASLTKKTVETPTNLSKTLQPDVQSEILLPKVSETLQSDLPKIKNFKLINFCYNILHELENTSYANLFYKCIKNDVKNNIINHPMDLFTINLNLENNQYTSLEDFEKDIRLIFCNCYTYKVACLNLFKILRLVSSKFYYRFIIVSAEFWQFRQATLYTYNDVGSEIYSSGKALESIFNKKWNEELILKGKQIKELKRTRDNDADDTDRSWKKQSQVLEQNKDNLMYRQIVNDALLVTSAYESLVIGNIIPFIEILKTFLLTRSKMSLSSANESMLQSNC
ncbi:Bdf1p [Rhizophagus irregularis DAOM 197198w]|uniref:Bdf1p n=1 Tax=Rhizophagus irregularis (strain DAOM 197198w) TaxID=1432141 RepID=A0A015JST5_RHIIW|nr:Bdf1p [Rhizophagus irregularis DAOM 197198w]